MPSKTDAYFLEIKQRLNALLVQSESLKHEIETLKNDKKELEKKLVEKEQTIKN